MSDGQGEAGQSGSVQDDAGQQGGGSGAPEWLGSLPDDLKGDVNLTRYANVEALSRAHLEARKQLGAPRLPTADAALENFEAFHAVRPAEAAAYEIDVPDGYGTDYADGFRKVAHDVGLHPSQVKQIVAFNNDAIAAQMEAAQAAAGEEVASFKSELTAAGGDYERQIASVAAMLEKHGLGDADRTQKAIEGIEAQLGAGDTLRLLTGLAQAFGEPGTDALNGDGGDGGGFNLASATVDQIRAHRAEKMATTGWATAAQSAGTPEHKEYQRIIAAEAAAVQRQNRG